MAGPIALAAALSRTITITCPWCRHRKLVTKTATPAGYRVCPRCKRHFPDPLATKRGGRTRR
jgi:hypothetical protein